MGLQPRGAVDTRPWLDLGFWDVQHPLGDRSAAPQTRPPYPFLPTEGEGLHQIPVGPVHAGIIEPGHFRFTANGETVVRLEQRLGYVHKGIELADDRRFAREGARGSRAAPPATARSPMRWPSPAPSKPRSTSTCRGGRTICAR